MLQRTILQRTNATTDSFYQLNQDATTNDPTTNECYNDEFNQLNQDATTNDPTTNECYNEQFLSIKSRCYNERMLQGTVFIN